MLGLGSITPDPLLILWRSQGVDLQEPHGPQA